MRKKDKNFISLLLQFFKRLEHTKTGERDKSEHMRIDDLSVYHTLIFHAASIAYS
jgi:hypothetical protein